VYHSVHQLQSYQTGLLMKIHPKKSLTHINLHQRYESQIVKLSFGPVRFGGRKKPHKNGPTASQRPHQKDIHGEIRGTHEAVDSDDKVGPLHFVDISNIKRYNTLLIY